MEKVRSGWGSVDLMFDKRMIGVERGWVVVGIWGDVGVGGISYELFLVYGGCWMGMEESDVLWW